MIKAATRNLLWGFLGLAGFGFVAQSIMAALDERVPAPGRLVDVDGHLMHIQCSGDGDPTVLLETISDGTAAYWGLVQELLSPVTRTCSYDRAGRGWSEPGPEPRDANAISNDLHELLRNASISPPYVLVGHSAGGLFALRFAQRYPDTIGALVLLDSAAPDQATLDPSYITDLEKTRDMVGVMRWLSYFGVERLVGALLGRPEALPAPSRHAMARAYASSAYWASLYHELQARRASDAQVAQGGSLRDTPLTVAIAAVGGSPQTQQRLATLSSNSAIATINEATHMSLIFDRRHAQAVAELVRARVETMR